MSTIWTDDFLNQLAVDAEEDIQQEIECIFDRQYLPTVVGQSVYTLPDSIRAIKRITWRGRKLDPANWEDLQSLSPHTAYVDPADKVETSVSRPWWYALHPTNIHDIRFYPTPDETFDGITGDPFSPGTNEPQCTISCWRNIDITNPLYSLPTYVDRRTRKAYILWKAFEKEGKGQNLSASKYYKQKYSFLIEQFRTINQAAFLSKRYSLDDGSLSTLEARRYPKPSLPPQFERIIF